EPGDGGLALLGEVARLVDREQGEAEQHDRARNDRDRPQEALQHAREGPSRMAARERLIDELRSHALVIGEVVLTSGQVAQYYVDAKREILRPARCRALTQP